MSNEITGTIQSHELIGQVGYQGGGSGSSDYNELINKPSINGTTLVEDTTLDELNIASKDYVNNTKPTKTSELTNDSNFAKTNSNNNFETSQTINGTLTVNGDIVQKGEQYETHAEKVYTEKNEIVLRDKAIGGMTQEEFAGLVALLYNGIVSGRLGFKADGTAYVGDVGDEQPLLTRDDITNLVDGQVLIWDGTKLRAVGSSNFVSFNDIGSTSKAGIFKVSTAYGTYIRSNGVLQTVAASNDEIDERDNNFKVISPTRLDYAIVSGLTNNSIQLTEEQKTKIKNWLGL